MERTSPGSTPPADGSDASGNQATRAKRDTVTVGVLSTHNSKETKAILNAVRALGHDPVWIRDENATSRITNGSVTVSPSVDVLVNRLLVTKSSRPLEDLELAALYGDTAPVLNPSSAVARAVHKFRAGATLAAAGLPVPDAYFGRSPSTVEEWREHLQSDAAHKRTIGTNGRGMAVVSHGDPVGPSIDDEQSFVQEFIESAGDRPSDVRAYVVDDTVVAAMRRRAPEGDWRTNVALGGDVEDATADLDAAGRRVAVDAVDALGLDVGGVDLMTVDSDWTVLEVNATAGFKGLFGATGVSVAPHIARLAVERAGGTVDSAAVSELSSTLDDAVPDCKPPREDADVGGGVLGYTNEVRVNGRDGVETVVAKSDTGAKRTSIDTELAGRTGAGPLVGTTDVRAGSGEGVQTRPLVDVDVRLNGQWRTVTASISDRSGMTYPVLLGRDVLESHTLDISQRAEE